MSDKSDLKVFIDNYIEILNNVDYKISFFKDLSDKAYIEISLLLPKINSSLKDMVKKIEATVETLQDNDIKEEDLESVTNIVNEFKQIPGIILAIMTSLQVQDAVEQCIAHIMSSIDITRSILESTDAGLLDTETFNTIKYLKIMPELIAAQLENIYNKMNDNLCYLPRKFRAIFEILRPTITLKELLDESKEKNKMEILNEELINISDNSHSAILKEKLAQAIEDISELENTIPENTHMLDISSAASRRLEQPLAEILFLNDNLSKTSNSSADILDSLYEGDSDKLDCSDKLEKIAVLFSTKGEIEVARSILQDIKMEETGEEGDLELF